jgi:hypothetical protein
MTVFHEIASLIEHLAWPGVALTALLVFRAEIRTGLGDIATRITKFTGWGMSAEFLASETRRRLEITASPLTPEQMQAAIELQAALPSSPPLRSVGAAYDAVFEALRRRTTELQSQGRVPPNADASTLASILAMEGDIPQGVRDAVGVLQTLREQALDAPSEDWTSKAAHEFQALSASIIARLEP